jgi:glycosyltransferase involved in cell wall biosynthesis
MKDIEFYMKNLTMKDFLYSKESWNFISETYEKNCPELPFIDYFWTLRNMHAPVWKIASIVGNMPNCRVLHSPSTGYAGFLGFLASNDKKIPFILTEHGIYTRERKIDMLSANWITFNRLALLKNEPEEFNYIKKMWVNFFEKIGKLSYEKADYIISLYPGAKDIQIEFGADSNKTIVIPNGVDMKRLNSLVQKREGIPPIITLIGRVVSIKDIKTFIRAIAIVKKSMPNIEGWIAGPTDEDEDYAQECFDMVDFFDLKENVKFLGFQKIDDILPKSGLLTLTSISEGMPLVILEGFAAGLPCIATDVGSCSDLIYGALDDEDKEIGEAGAVTTIANPSALAENYIKFLSDENLWKKAQKNGLLRVEKYYQDHFFLDNYKNLYSKAI